MEVFDLIQQIKSGDSTAFEKWMDIHSKNIELLAIQYGYSRDHARKLTEETFRTLHNDLENQADDKFLLHSLYKIALNGLEKNQQATQSGDIIFRFEEDQQLHEEIIRLDEKKKVSFILSQFHGMKASDIATVTGSSEEAVRLSIAEAHRQIGKQIGGSQLEKRLEFLNKSYGRMSPLFRKENVFQEPLEELQETLKQNPKIKKKPLLFWIAGIFALLTLIIVPVVTGEEYKKNSAEKYVERLKSSFEDEITNKFNEMGLIESTIKELYSDPNSYGQLARDEFDTMTSNLERTISKNESINKKMIEKQYDEILMKLQLPSEMAEQLFENPLTNDIEKSGDFIKEYLEKYNLIRDLYFMTIYKHEEIISERKC